MHRMNFELFTLNAALKHFTIAFAIFSIYVNHSDQKTTSIFQLRTSLKEYIHIINGKNRVDETAAVFFFRLDTNGQIVDIFLNNFSLWNHWNDQGN